MKKDTGYPLTQRPGGLMTLIGAELRLTLHSRLKKGRVALLLLSRTPSSTILLARSGLSLFREELASYACWDRKATLTFGMSICRQATLNCGKSAFFHSPKTFSRRIRRFPSSSGIGTSLCMSMTALPRRMPPGLGIARARRLESSSSRFSLLMTSVKSSSRCIHTRMAWSGAGLTGYISIITLRTSWTKTLGLGFTTFPMRLATTVRFSSAGNESLSELRSRESPPLYPWLALIILTFAARLRKHGRTRGGTLSASLHSNSWGSSKRKCAGLPSNWLVKVAVVNPLSMKID